VLEVSRCEAEFQTRVGEHYEHGGGSGGGGGGGVVKGLFRRATLQRERFRDFAAIRAKAPVQTWIDTGGMGYVNSLILLWYCFIICSHIIVLCFRRGGPFFIGKRH
jgi:hypothetical protein